MHKQKALFFRKFFPGFDPFHEGRILWANILALETSDEAIVTGGIHPSGEIPRFFVEISETAFRMQEEALRRKCPCWTVTQAGPAFFATLHEFRRLPEIVNSGIV